MVILTNVSKSIHGILQIFAIETNFLVVKNMVKKISQEKYRFRPFGPNIRAGPGWGH